MKFYFFDFIGAAWNGEDGCIWPLTPQNFVCKSVWPSCLFTAFPVTEFQAQMRSEVLLQGQGGRLNKFNIDSAFEKAVSM